MQDERIAITAFREGEEGVIHAVSGGRGLTSRLAGMGVAPGARGKAAGWELLKAGVRHLKGRGPANISLTVDSENRPARRIYERAGFRHGFDLFWYELRLV